MPSPGAPLAHTTHPYTFLLPPHPLRCSSRMRRQPVRSSSRCPPTSGEPPPLRFGYYSCTLYGTVRYTQDVSRLKVLQFNCGVTRDSIETQSCVRSLRKTQTSNARSTENANVSRNLYYYHMHMLAWVRLPPTEKSGCGRSGSSIAPWLAPRA